jgi:hypothetical protein
LGSCIGVRDKVVTSWFLVKASFAVSNPMPAEAPIIDIFILIQAIHFQIKKGGAYRTSLSE